MTHVKLSVHTGPQVHVDVFVRTAPADDWIWSGELVFDIEQWVVILPTLPKDWVLESGSAGGGS
ncbi:MAG: hypothetical protein AAF211_28475 [Myxococcota bacterium]